MWLSPRRILATNMAALTSIFFLCLGYRNYLVYSCGQPSRYRQGPAMLDLSYIIMQVATCLTDLPLAFISAKIFQAQFFKVPVRKRKLGKTLLFSTKSSTFQTGESCLEFRKQPACGAPYWSDLETPLFDIFEIFAT